ncbi:MAG: hypothetical protein M1827_001535 [Pycnora praestabilis]|nr:MAG: hypothetical protein M1827_001535 [Pycnora praestabilis]
MSTASHGYVPPPSVGHEIGVMFGFIGAMILAMVLYGFVWQMGQKRSAKKEEERKRALAEKGYGEKAPARNGGGGGGDDGGSYEGGGREMRA